MVLKRLKSNRLLLSIMAVGFAAVTVVTVCVTALFPSAISQKTVASGSILSIGRHDFQFVTSKCNISSATDNYTDFATNIRYGAGAAGFGFVKNWKDYTDSEEKSRSANGIFWDARNAAKGKKTISGEVFSVNFPEAAYDRKAYYDVRLTVSDIEFYLAGDIPAAGSPWTKGFVYDMENSEEDIWQNSALCPVLVDRGTALSVSTISPRNFNKRRGMIATVRIDIIPHSDTAGAWVDADPVDGTVPMYFEDVDTGYWTDTSMIEDVTELYEGIELFPGSMDSDKVYTYPEFQANVDSGRNYVYGKPGWDTYDGKEASFTYMAKASQTIRTHGASCWMYLFQGFYTYSAKIVRDDTLGTKAGGVSVQVNDFDAKTAVNSASHNTFVSDDVEFIVTAKAGYYIDSITRTARYADEAETDIPVTDESEMVLDYGDVQRIVPQSDSPSVTDGNSLYSFAGLSYEVRHNGTVISRVSALADGSVPDVAGLAPGEYTVVSVNGNEPYGKAVNMETVVLQAGETLSVVMVHPPAHDPNGVTVNKDWMR